MSTDQLPPSRQTDELLRSVRSWIRALTVAVLFMAMALLLTVATVFGYLVEYHGGEALLKGAVTIAAAVLAFGFGLAAGWLAGRRR